METTSNLFSFKVENVTPSTTVPKDFLTPEACFRKFFTPTEKNGEDNSQKIKIEDFSHRNSTDTFISRLNNGFLSTLHEAYQEHYNLTLSVSDFIILIGQGLSEHIYANAEKLRNQFVDFQDKEHIIIIRDEFRIGQQNDWSGVLTEFADTIKQKVKSNVHEIIVDDTSVATQTTQAASEIALMNAMKAYFVYVVLTRCGIPEITLKGAPEDWQKLQTKVDKLVELNKDNKLDLKWWLDHLVPVVKKICETGITRKADPNFWKNIYKFKGALGSGTDTISGWCTVFFPYGPEKKRNAFTKDYGTFTKANFPKGISEVPFIWSYMGKHIPMDFYGGFLGAKFNKEKMSVETETFWCIAYSLKDSLSEEDVKKLNEAIQKKELELLKA